MVIEANHAGSVERRPALPHCWPWEGHIMISLVFLNLAFTASHATLVSARCALRAQAQLGTIGLSDACLVPVPGHVLEWFEAICRVWNLSFFGFTLKPHWVKEASQSQKARSTLYHVFRDIRLWLPEVEREKLKEGE